MTVHEPQCQGEGDRHLLATDRNANGELVPNLHTLGLDSGFWTGSIRIKNGRRVPGWGCIPVFLITSGTRAPPSKLKRHPTSSTEPGGRHT
jgi:hypothetical protein